MQTLSSLSGSEILRRTQDLVTTERRTTMELIEHLREIEKRMLFLKTGHSSLFEFAVKHLGLSEGSAQRRISAMRLIRDIPEAKKKLESGEISLSNAAQVQSAFRAVKAVEKTNSQFAPKMGIDAKKEILEKISGMTQRECQSVLLELVPEAGPKLMERDRQVSDERFELKLAISKELHDQIDELKILLSHSLQSGGTSELLEYLVKQEIRRQEKRHGVTEKPEVLPDRISEKEVHKIGLIQSGAALVFTAAPVRNKTNRSRKAIPRPIQREVWRKAKGRCEFQGCESRYRLEIDHIVPYSNGGAHTIDNLRLYCRAHNLGHARDIFGSEKMNEYRKY